MNARTGRQPRPADANTRTHRRRLAASNTASGASPFALDLFSLGFDAAWEIDIFGGVARSVEAARANTAAALWQLRDAQVSLCAEVADAYLTLRSTQLRISIVRESADHQQQILDLTQARARTGFVTELDVNQQRAQLAATQAELPQLEAEERASIHALDVLLGQAPEELAGELTAAAPVPAVPATLPVGLPSDLLRRRPSACSSRKPRPRPRCTLPKSSTGQGSSHSSTSSVHPPHC